MPPLFDLKPNRAGIRQLLSDPGVAADLTARAGRVAAAARGRAPRVTGAYANSIEVVSDTSGVRARARVVARVPYAQKVESRYRVLGSSLDAAGG